MVDQKAGTGSEALVTLVAAAPRLQFATDDRGWVLSAGADGRPVARFDGFGGEPLGVELQAHAVEGSWLVRVESTAKNGWRIVARTPEAIEPVATYDPRGWMPGGEISTIRGSCFRLNLNVIPGNWTLDHAEYGRLATIRPKPRSRYEIEMPGNSAAVGELPLVLLMCLRVVLYDRGFIVTG